jgi:hypothetical protein
MALLPKRPYINLERACKELCCTTDDLVDCWLSEQINFYYILQGEKIVINYLCDYGGLGKKFFQYGTHFYNDDITQLYGVRVQREKDNCVSVKGKGYGAFIISPMKSTRFVQDAIYIISPDFVNERETNGLITAGYCHLHHPKTKDIVIINEACSIDGLKVSLTDLFVMRKDIARFIESSGRELSKDPRYWINVAIYTQRYYLQQNIHISKSKLASKIADISGKAYSTIMKDWFKDTDIKTAEELKGTNKHGNKPVDDFDLISPETGVKLSF